MPSSQENRQKANKDKDDLRHALDPIVTDANAPNPSSRIALVSKAIMSPFSLYKKSESTKILSDRTSLYAYFFNSEILTCL